MQTPERLENSGRTQERASMTLAQRRTMAEAQGLPKEFMAIESSQIQGAAWLDGEGKDLMQPEGISEAQVQDAGDLHVIFRSKGSPRWKYEGVQGAKVLGLLRAESAGRYFGAEIKAGPYRASKVGPASAS